MSEQPAALFMAITISECHRLMKGQPTSMTSAGTIRKRPHAENPRSAAQPVAAAAIFPDRRRELVCASHDACLRKSQASRS